MDAYQQIAYKTCIEGHNTVICGQAGSGKSVVKFLLKKIVEDIRSKGKTVHVVSSTGISAIQFSSFGGTTLHKWAGIVDGRYLNEEILHLVQTDERFVSNLENIRSVDTLAMDEVSMESAKIFKQVELLCRKIRGSDAVFGGIQNNTLW